MRSERSVSCAIASPTAAEEEAATSRIASLAELAASTPSSATARASPAAWTVAAATSALVWAERAAPSDRLARGLDAADLALGAGRDLADGGGDLVTARPVSSEVAAICSEAAATVPAPPASAPIVSASWRAQRVVGLDRGQRLLADRADGPGDVAELVVATRDGAGANGSSSTVRSPLAAASSAWRRSAVSCSLNCSARSRSSRSERPMPPVNHSARPNPPSSAAGQQQLRGRARGGRGRRRGRRAAPRARRAPARPAARARRCARRGRRPARSDAQAEHADDGREGEEHGRADEELRAQGADHDAGVIGTARLATRKTP